MDNTGRRKPRDQWSWNTPPYRNNGHTGNRDFSRPSKKCKRKLHKEEKCKKNFLGRCSKLLHNMLELDDSKQCRTAPDKLKYPDYCSKVLYPMDLSKVRQKLQAGDYTNPDDFGADICVMLDNWKGYIQDQSLPIYGQVTRLSWWFHSEFAKITDAYKSYKTKRQRLVGSMSDSINASGPQDHNSHSALGNESPGGSTEAMRDVRLSSAPSGTTEEPGIVVSIRHGTCSVLHHPQAQTSNTTARWTQGQGSNGPVPRVPGPGQHSPMHRAQVTPMHGQDQRSTTSRPQPTTKSHQTGGVNGLVDRGLTNRRSSLADSTQQRLSRSSALTSSQTSTTSAQATRTSTSLTSTRGALAAATSSKTPPSQHQLPQTRPQSGPGTSLEMRASNIWFGDFHIRSEKPVTLTEQGFTFTLNGERTEEVFQVSGKEIVRCLAHLGKQKNTLFVFISPACEQRLKNTISKLQPGQETKICSLFVIFLQEMAKEVLGHLVYYFWTMSRSSLFGQLFSEVDRNGALELLANIKPSILQRLKNASSTPTATAATASNPGPSRSETPSARNRPSEKNGASQSRSKTARANSSRSSSTSADEGNCMDNRRDEVGGSVASSDTDMGTVHLRRSSQSERTVLETPVSNATGKALRMQRTLTESSLPTPPHELLSTAPFSQRTAASTSIPQHQPYFSNTQTTMPSVHQPPPNFFTPACSTNTTSSAMAGLHSEGCRLTSSRPDSTLDGSYFSSFLSDIPSLQPPQPVFPIMSASQPHTEMPYHASMLFCQSNPHHEQLAGQGLARPSCGQLELVPEAYGPTPNMTTAGPSGQVPSVEFTNQSSPDLDLEIIIPSDDDDDDLTVYIPNKPDEKLVGADGDDLVMLHSHISTRCPITQQVMKQPVKNRHCGHFYDREGVQQLIINRAEKARCPVPGCGNRNPLLMQDMDFDQELLNFITSRNAEKKEDI